LEKDFGDAKITRIILIKVVVFFKLVDEDLNDDRDLVISKVQEKNLKLKNELKKTIS